ncbi:MAG: transposase [Gemmatimonadetes bacterium]|nr:transposase [Gemmatimonadota bacterium]
MLEAWRQDYNDHRLHTTLGLQPPAVHRRAGIFEPRTVRVINSR